MATLGELAQLVRSKNAGPWTLTFDILFGDTATYERVKRSRVLNPRLFAETYGVPEHEVSFIEHDSALALKASIPRPAPSGDPADTDVFGGQQHGPLVNLEIPD